MKQWIPIAIAMSLAACATDKPPELPPPPPRADFCVEYTPWQMSPSVAANESIENLRAHANNQLAHYERCVTDLGDRSKSMGPR